MELLPAQISALDLQFTSHCLDYSAAPTDGDLPGHAQAQYPICKKRGDTVVAACGEAILGTWGCGPAGGQHAHEPSWHVSPNGRGTSAGNAGACTSGAL